jgi:multiple sugar transport system permease protein
MNLRQRIGPFWLQILLILGVFVIGFPFLWVVSQSFMSNTEIFDVPPRLIPRHPTLENYYAVFTRQDLQLGRWFINSVSVSSVITILVLAVASTAAYAFARLRFPGRDIIFYAALATMMIPGQVTLIPIFLLMRDLKFLDTYHALIWPAGANVFGVFLLRQFFLTIPRELEEAAILDGASRFGVYRRVVLPLSSSALVALGIFTFLGSWNDLFWPLIVLNRLEMRTLPVGLAILVGEYGYERALGMAGATVALIPVLIFYTIFQRRIIEGVTLTGMGGR